MRDEVEIRLAVERASTHLVRALSVVPPNMNAYRAAFQLPGVESRPGEGPDGVVIANLLAIWAEGVCLFPQEIFPPVQASPASDEYRAGIVAAAASGDRRRLKDILVLVINLSEDLLGDVTYSLASDYTHLIRLSGGLPAVQDITAILQGATASPVERNIVPAASLIVSAMSCGATRNAYYAIDQFTRRPGGPHALTQMVGVLLRAAWVTIEKAAPATGLRGADDERLRVTGFAPRGESARSTLRLVRKSIFSLSTTDTDSDFVLHATALVNLPLPDLVVAVRYTAALVARHASTALRTMVAQAADALDPDRRR